MVRAPKRTSIRLEPATNAPEIGTLEVGTEVYLIDIVAGWASVLPRSLTVMPAGEHQFWVDANDLRVGARPSPTE